MRGWLVAGRGQVEQTAGLWRHPGGHLLLGGLDLTLVPDRGQPLCGQWLLLQPVHQPRPRT